MPSLNSPYKTDRQREDSSFFPYAALFIIAISFYLKTLDFAFLSSWDDDIYILNNPFIKEINASNIKAIFSNSILSLYSPLHVLTYSFDYAVWGLNPIGYHLTNIILHGLTAAAVYAVVVRLTDKKLVAFFAALIFVLHPINVENVAWVSERKSLLASLLALISFVFYLEWRNYGKNVRLTVCAALFILALFAKPVTVVLPLLFLSYEIVLRPGDRKLLHIIPFFIVSVIFSAATVWINSKSGAITEGTLSADFLFGTVYPTMAPTLWNYPALVFWPMNLNGLYDAPMYQSFTEPVVAISIIAIITAFVLFIWKGSPMVRFWFLWFCLWLLPSSNIIPIPVFYADRYMYMPAIAIYMLIAEITIGLTAYKKPVRDGMRAFGIIAAITIALFYGTIASDRQEVWRNDITFWEDTAHKSPRSYKARLNLGFVYDINGRYEDAEKEYLAAIGIYRSPEALSNLLMVRKKIKYSKQR